jgi:hypothetical protein
MSTESHSPDPELNPAGAQPQGGPLPIHEASSASALKTIEEQYIGLRRLLSISLFFMLIFSMSVNLYLYRQMRSTRADMNAAKPQVEALRAQYQQQQPMIEGFLRNLVAFGRSHPDFNPILMKHGIIPRNTAADIGVPTRPME